MKKWLCTILFLFISLTSFAPNINLSDREEENSNFKLLFKDVVTNTLLDATFYPATFPIVSPILVDSIRISSEFGMRHDPFDGLVRNHMGLDILSSKTATIVATASGVVEKVVYSNYGYGNYIVIRHENNIRTKYAHLSEMNVKEGDIVRRFDPIGTIGRTGRATGIHLHYEILDGLKPIDPASIFNVQTKEEYISALKKMEIYVKFKNIII